MFSDYEGQSDQQKECSPRAESHKSIFPATFTRGHQACFCASMLELLMSDPADEQLPLVACVVSGHFFAVFDQACSVGTAGLIRHAKEWVKASESLGKQRLGISIPHNHLVYLKTCKRLWFPRETPRNGGLGQPWKHVSCTLFTSLANHGVYIFRPTLTYALAPCLLTSCPHPRFARCENPTYVPFAQRRRCAEDMWDVCAQ